MTDDEAGFYVAMDEANIFEAFGILRERLFPKPTIIKPIAFSQTKYDPLLIRRLAYSAPGIKWLTTSSADHNIVWADIAGNPINQRHHDNRP